MIIEAPLQRSLQIRIFDPTAARRQLRRSASRSPKASATSKSAVSRRFVAMTETALAELLPRICPGWTWWR